jgi:hypothetical protein
VRREMNEIKKRKSSAFGISYCKTGFGEFDFEKIFTRKR